MAHMRLSIASRLHIAGFCFAMFGLLTSTAALHSQEPQPYRCGRYLRGTPYPVIVSIKDSSNCIGVTL